jgi:hypothetical protein
MTSNGLGGSPDLSKSHWDNIEAVGARVRAASKSTMGLWYSGQTSGPVCDLMRALRQFSRSALSSGRRAICAFLGSQS